MSFYFTFWFYHFIYITAMALHSGHFHSLDAWSNYVLLVMKYCFHPGLGQYFTEKGINIFSSNHYMLSRFFIAALYFHTTSFHVFTL
jgi:hypothetical protein